MNGDSILKVVGRPAVRNDARDKVSGRARYSVDFALPHMLHAKALRSPMAHARIAYIDASAARVLPGVKAVLTRDDLPVGMMPYCGYLVKDQPIVAIEKVRYIGDIVAAVAAVDERTANRALALIKVGYEDLPMVPTIETALSDEGAELFETPPFGRVPTYGDGASAKLRPRKNVCFEFDYETGDPAAFAECDFIFEDEFRFSRMHHFHLEPFITLANWTSSKLEVISSVQNPFPLRREISRIFNVPENFVKVRVPYVGGGFGSKNNCKTEPIAVLLSRMTGKPVRFCLTLEECFLTNTQHDAVLRLKTGVMKDGSLVARESEVLLNAGAYADASPLVAEKAGYRMPGPYRYKYIKSAASAVMTNTAPSGPFRGFGGTQATWASESQIDMIARRLDIDPYDMRVKNLIKLGEPFVPGEQNIDSDLRGGLDVVAREIGYHNRQRKPNRGMGLSIGFKDGGGINKPALARVKASSSGDIFLHCGTVEIGQGGHTAMSQIVAEVLGSPLARVSYVPIDTDYTPFDLGTNASSGVAVMGQAVELAARNLKTTVLAFAAGSLNCSPDDIELENWSIRKGNDLVSVASLIAREYGPLGYEFSADGFYKVATDHHAPLDAKCSFFEIGWGAAEVEVDPETGRVEVLKLVVSSDVGHAINKLTCKGQEDGSAIMGYGQTMFERMIYDGVNLVNGEALQYRVPLAEDLPRSFVSITQEQGFGPGPFGAKGAGEGAMLPVASAIANAVQDAIGVRITELPITPERILKALSETASHYALK